MIQVYDKGKLSEQFKEYLLKTGLPNNLLPYWQDCYGYRCDWNIIGGEESKNLFELYNGNNTFSLDQKKEVINWLKWISKKIFKPDIFLLSSYKTDAVNIRIAVSLLDKINIPKLNKDVVFDNFVYTYWERKRAYDTFYYLEIMKLPFIPDDPKDVPY